MCSAVSTHVLQSLGDADSTDSLSCCLQTVFNGTAAHQHFQLSHCDCLRYTASHSFAVCLSRIRFSLLLFCSLFARHRVGLVLSQFALRVPTSTARRTLNSLCDWPPNLYAATSDVMSVS